jgi:nitrogen fixation/metabolism regulation signal transduction histidine kinase
VSPSASPAAAAPPRPKFKRSAKNYLLDTRFQLKYTSYIVGLTLVISIALGALLYRQASKTVEIGNEAVAVGADANKAGKEAVMQSNALNAKLEMDAMKGYGDDPGLIQIVKDANKEQTDAITARAAQLEASNAKLERQRQALEDQQRNLMFTLVGILTALVVLVGLAGIVVTHKVAGPIFKMKRLLREVGEGKLVVQGHLRKGDELQDFFEIFAKMILSLRSLQEREIAHLDAAITEAEKVNTDETVLKKLHALRAHMQLALDQK